MRIAVIDVGTNTLLLTVADCHGSRYTILADEHRVARLGERLEVTGMISDNAIQRAEEIIRTYCKTAGELGVDYRYGVGTSVFRLAKNSKDVADYLASLWGGPIDILTGQEEASLTYWGTVDDETSAAVLDIGGGSTELTIGNNGKIIYHRSTEIGAVRMTERYWQSYPTSPEMLDAARRYIHSQLALLPLNLQYDKLYAVAGTPTTLAIIAQGISTFDWYRIDGYILSTETIASLCYNLCIATLEQLRSMPGVHPARADILPAGTLILREFIEWLGVNSLIVSARGLRYGVLKKCCTSFVANNIISR